MFDNREHLLGGPHQALSVVGLIYDTLEDPSLWPLALAAIGAAIGAPRSALIFRDTQAPGGAVGFDHELGPAVTEPYQAYYGGIDVWFGAAQLVTPGRATRGTDLVPEQTLRKTEFHADFLIPSGVAHQAGLTLERDASRFGVASFYRDRTHEPFSPEDLAALEFLAPHLRRVLRLQSQLSNHADRGNGLTLALNAFGRAVFGLAADGTVLFATPRADQLAVTGDPLSVRSGRLQLRSARHDIQLKAIIAGATASSRFADLAATTGALVVKDSGGHDAQIAVIPYLGSGPREMGDGLAALVFVSLQSDASTSRSHLLQHLYRLTPLERRVVDHLAEGLSVPVIADRIGAKANAIRFHIKNIFRKMNVSRQSELIRLVLSLPGNAGEQGSPEA